MNELVALERQPAPPDSEFEKLEREHKIKLPSAFVTFFRQYNCAKLDYIVFDEGDRERLIERFLGLLSEFESNPLGMYDISVVIAQIGERLVDDGERVGYNVIPFGALFAGDFVCLDFRHSNEPSVAVWDHEQSDDFAPVLTKVADSFTAFEQLLRQHKIQ